MSGYLPYSCCCVCVCFFFFLTTFGFTGSSSLVGLSLVVWSGGYSLVVVHELLIAVTFTVEHELQSTWASIVTVHGLRHSEVCGIFPDQGLNLCLLYWQTDSLPLSHQGSPPLVGFYEKESVMNMLSWSPFVSCFRKCDQGAGDGWTPGAHLLTPGCVNRRPAVNT